MHFSSLLRVELVGFGKEKTGDFGNGLKKLTVTDLGKYIVNGHFGKRSFCRYLKVLFHLAKLFYS